MKKWTVGEHSKFFFQTFKNHLANGTEGESTPEEEAPPTDAQDHSRIFFAAPSKESGAGNPTHSYRGQRSILSFNKEE